MPRLAVDTTATSTLNQRSENPSPLAQRFASSPVAEPMSTDVSPLRRQRDAQTLSPVALLNHRERKFPTETTVEEIGQPQRSKRQAPSKSTVLTSFTSSSTRPPPSSVADTTPQQAFIAHQDGDEEEEEDMGTIPVDYKHTSEFHTPPRPNRTLNSPSTIRPSRSPTRATSVPLSPVYRSALVEGSEDGAASPHRVTSSMAKRSARTRSGKKVPLLPLASEYTMSPTKSIKGSKQVLIPDEVLEEGGDEEEEDDEPPGLEPNPIAATQSMPELRESPERRPGPFLAFIPRILESEKTKRTQQQHKSSTSAGVRLATLTEHSAEQETEISSMSMGSREIREYKRLDKDIIEQREFKLTQVEHGLNPPGIFVNSQSQSDHGYSHSSGDRSAPIDIRLGRGAMRERMPTTLVVGTPSTVSEGSQPEKGSDMSLSQLARDGQALLQRSSPEEWTRTQSIAGTQLLTQILATQEVLEPTQDLGVTQDAHDIGMELEDGADEYPLMGPPQISPRKQKGYSESPKKPKENSVSPSKRRTHQDSSQTQKGFWSSSSGTSSSIPGLSMSVKEDVFMATAKSSGASGRDENNISQHSVSRGPRNQNASSTKTNNFELLSRPSPSKSSSVPTKSPTKQAAIPNGTSARSTRPPNLLRSSRPQNNNIPAIPPQGIQVYTTTSRFFPTMSEPIKPPPTTTMTNNKPVKAKTVPLKRNPLARRRSPAAIDRHLFEATPPDPEPAREADKGSAFERRFIEGSGLARDETLLVEDETQRVQQPPPTILSETAMRMDGMPAAKKTESIHSEAEESVVMDTDGEGVELLETLPLDDSRHREYEVPIHALTESPKEMQEEIQPEKSEKPVILSGKTLVSSKGGSEARPTSAHRSSSKASKGSKSDAANSKKAQSTDSRKNRRTRNKGYDGSSDSSEHDNTGDYKPGESQAQDRQMSTTRRGGDLAAAESFRNEDSDPEVLFRRETISTSRKRSAKSQNGPNSAKRRRMNSPKAESPVETTTSRSRTNQKSNEEPIASITTTTANSKPVLAPLQTSGNQFVSTRRNTRNRGMSSTRAIITEQIGHLVLARSSENKTYYPGFAVERARRTWQIEPLQPGPAMFVEPKNMRRCTFKPGDFVKVAPSANGGEDFGEAIVIAVDERWDEERAILVRIGGEDGEQRHVHVRHLSVPEKYIKNVWDDRKITHEDLEKDDGAESVVPSAAPLSRANSMAIPTPAKAFAASFNRSPQAYPSYFKGFGFIVTGCDQLTTKHLQEAGGYIYDSWLSAYEFDGGLEKVGRKGTAERWIRKQPGVSGGRGRSKSTEVPALQWIGNRDEQNVKTLFVVAGGDVKLTSKTLIGLAFGVPYVSSKWIEECHKVGNRVSWHPFQLPSHNLPNPLSVIPNIPPAQSLDSRWGFYDSATALDEILTHEPLLHRRILLDKPRVLYIAPNCIERLKQDGEEHDSPACNVPFVYCCLAMGAQHVEAVDEHTHATDPTLSKYDLIIVADQLLESTQRHDKSYRDLERLLDDAKEKHTMVIDQSDIKMSIACGTLLTISNSA